MNPLLGISKQMTEDSAAVPTEDIRNSHIRAPFGNQPPGSAGDPECGGEVVDPRSPGTRPIPSTVVFNIVITAIRTRTDTDMASQFEYQAANPMMPSSAPRIRAITVAAVEGSLRMRKKT